MSQSTAHVSTHGTRLIPMDELRDQLQQLDPSQKTVVYCRVGLRGYLASRILLQHGFTKVFNLTGGYLSSLNKIRFSLNPGNPVNLRKLELLTG